MYYERNDLRKLVFGTLSFSIFFILLCTSIFIFLPYEKKSSTVSGAVSELKTVSENTGDLFASNSSLNDLVVDTKKKDDCGLVLYRQPQSKIAVEWFYSRITNDKEISSSILQYADMYNIPLSLAFALAYTESRYNVNAIHVNTNGTVDRGLFQLNDSSFPKISEIDFYNADVSARYGLSHLRFCLNTAGNEIAALAMYNAGTGSVKKNSTPQITLNYISQIENYRASIEELFAVEVLALYNTDSNKKLLAQNLR